MTDQAKTSADAAAPAGAAGMPAVDEFAHIPSPRARHPLVAAAAAALAFYLVFHVRADLRYALSPTEPLDLGDARATFAATAAPTGIDNRYVRVRATPDRESALELDTKGSWVFTQFFRVLGTGDRLFVHRRESPLPAFRAERDVFEGRLIRFGDLTFEDSIRAYFTRHVTATHFFAPADLGRAVAANPGGPLALRDRAGDAVTLAPADDLDLDVLRPDEVRIGLWKDRFPDQAGARAAIEQRGGTVVSVLGIEAQETAAAVPTSQLLSFGGNGKPIERWTFVARFPADKRDAALAGLEDADPKITIRDARETVHTRPSALRADGDALVVAAAADTGAAAGSGAGAPAATPRRLPLATLAAARTVATVPIPADAHLLIEADHPHDHLSTVLIAMLLAMFGVINVVALLKELRR
jgi:hypothetical protein